MPTMTDERADADELAQWEPTGGWELVTVELCERVLDGLRRL